MAKPGRASNVVTGGTARSVETRKSLVDAAVATLKNDGFARASARAISERAEVNQGLIFYHFGTVTNLLLAALDAVSADRMDKYRVAVENVSTPQELMEIAARIFRDDLDAGYVTVLVEMIAGANATPGLGVEVASRINPWFTFARDAIDKNFGQSPFASLLPSNDVAYVIVALYLGLEMLTHLNGDREPAMRLFTRAQELSTLFGVLGTSSLPGSVI